MTLCSAWNTLTDLAWMQENSILRQLPNKMSAKRNSLQLISCSSYTKHVRFCLYQSVSLSPSPLSEECPFSQWVPSLSSHPLLIPHSLYYHSIMYHHQSNPVHWIYNTVCKPPQKLLPCSEEPLTNRNHNMLLDSSSGVQSMIPCHEPLTIQLL